MRKKWLTELSSLCLAAFVLSACPGTEVADPGDAGADTFERRSDRDTEDPGGGDTGSEFEDTGSMVEDTGTSVDDTGSSGEDAGDTADADGDTSDRDTMNADAADGAGGSCTGDETRECGTSDGVCEKGTQTCTGGTWGDCQGETTGSSETCDGKDNNCDGEVDEGCDEDGDGYCDESRMVDGSPSVCPEGGEDCDDSDPDIYPGATGACDGKDNDCDGETDEIEAVPSKSQTTTHNASRSSSVSYKIKTAVSTPTDEGVCAAFLHEDGSLQWSHIKPDGTTVQKEHSLSGKAPKELFDIAWSGNNCGLMFRRNVSFTPDDDVYLARWNPSSPDEFEHVQLTTNTYNSEYNGHGAVEFISGTGWVSTYVETSAGNDTVYFATISDGFKGSDSPDEQTLTSVDVAASGPWPTLTIGESPLPSDEYAIGIASRWDGDSRYQLRLYTVDGSNNASEQKNVRDYFRPGDEWRRLQLDEVDGDHFLYFHTESTEKYWFWHIDTKFSSGNLILEVAKKGSISSGTRTNIFPTNLLGGTSGLGHWFVDPLTDKPWTFDPSGSSDISNFAYRTHPNMSTSDILQTLYADTDDDVMYIHSFTQRRPYESTMDGFSCP